MRVNAVNAFNLIVIQDYPDRAFKGGGKDVQGLSPAGEVSFFLGEGLPFIAEAG